MKSTLKTILIGLAVVLPLAASAVAATGWMATRPVGAVRVAGEFTQVSRDGLKSAVNAALTGGFFRVDVDEVRTAAMTLPWVREATVRRVWPDSIHIAIVERNAVARWNDRALLESDGSVFTPDDASADAAGGLPALRGPHGEQARVLAAYQQLAEAIGPFQDGVARVHLLPRGEWRVQLTSGVTLIPGAPLDVDEVGRMTRILPGLLGERLTAVSVIDLRYPNGFAVRWRKGEGPTQ